MKIDNWNTAQQQDIKNTHTHTHKGSN